MAYKILIYKHQSLLYHCLKSFINTRYILCFSTFLRSCYQTWGLLWLSKRNEHSLKTRQTLGSCAGSLKCCFIIGSKNGIQASAWLTNEAYSKLANFTQHELNLIFANIEVDIWDVIKSDKLQLASSETPEDSGKEGEMTVWRFRRVNTVRGAVSVTIFCANLKCSLPPLIS